MVRPMMQRDSKGVARPIAQPLLSAWTPSSRQRMAMGLAMMTAHTATSLSLTVECGQPMTRPIR